MADPCRPRRLFHRHRSEIVRSRRGFGPRLERVEERVLLSGNTYYVSSLADTGSGSGPFGDLRHAITQADLNPGSTIEFQVTGTIRLSSALPDLSADVTIDGPGASSLTVDGGSSNSSDFKVDRLVTASLSGITITGGGGANGGGVYDGGSLSLTDCTISGNSASHLGGGIVLYNSQNPTSLTMIRCTVSGNSCAASASGGGGGILAQSNSSHSQMSLTITDSIITGNKSNGIVGGIGVGANGALVMSGSTVSDNSAAAFGGIESNGTATITDSSITGNSSGGDAGGVYNGGLLIMSGSTISGNTAVENGGGLQVDATYLTSLTNCTISDNKAGHNGGGIIAGFGISASPTSGALTMTGGSITGNSATYGGGVFNGTTTLALTSCAISGNTAKLGGGLYNSAVGINPNGNYFDTGTFPYVATLTGTTLTGNSASTYGGAVFNLGNVTLTGSVLSGNSAKAGGGLAQLQWQSTKTNVAISSTFTLEGDTLSANQATTYGGGILNESTLTLTGSTLSGNTAAVGGGGLANVSAAFLYRNNPLYHNPPAYPSGKAVATLTNSTLSGNSSGSGGGVINEQGHLALTNDTLTGNRADSGTGGAIASTTNVGDILLDNSLIAGNFAGASPSTTPGDVNAALDPTSASNLIGAGDNLTGISNGKQGNQIGSASGGSLINPMLGPLADNGGLTKTMALLSGSPALDAGSNTLAASLTTDQRGGRYQRIYGKAVDIGAFEVQPPPIVPTQLVVTTQPPSSVTSNVPFGLTIKAEDGSGNVAPTFNGLVTLALTDNPGGAIGGGTLTATAVNGVATFSGLTLDKAGKGYSYQATGGGVTAAATTGFAVSPGPAVQLAFITQPPADVATGARFGLEVAEEDASGNVITTDTTPVTLTLTGNPTGATFGGTLTEPSVNGLAAFSGLTLSKAGSGYTIKAAGGGLYAPTAGAVTVTPTLTAMPSADLVIGSDGIVYTQALDSSGNPTGGYDQVAYGQVKDLAATRFGNTTNLEAFVIGTDNQVYAETTTGATKSGYFATAYGSIASVSVGTDASGNPLLFAIGTDNQLYEQTFNASGQATSPSYTKAAYGDFKSTVLTHDASGNPLLYAVGQDGQVYGLKMTASGAPNGGLFKMASGGVKQLAVGAYAGGDEIFVVGLDNNVYALKADATGSPTAGYFGGIGGPVESITVGNDASGKPLLFAIGTDSQVYGHKFNASGTPMGTFYGTAAGSVSAIAAGVGSGGNPEVFAVLATDSQVYAEPFDPTGTSTGPFALSTPGAVKKIVVV